MNFSEQNPLSVSSLTAAVKLNEPNVLRDLIKRGRNVNITDNRGWTPLHEASALGHRECLKILLRAGGRVEACTHQGETPLFIACEYNSLDCVKALLKWDNSVVNISNNESVTPLHVSCSKHSVPIAKLLIDNNALLNAEDNGGITPLHEAIFSKDVEVCKLLIDDGANLNSREYDGNLAFHFASMIGNIDIMNLLLNCYKNNLSTVINDVNCDGFTPLMVAVQGVCTDTVQELLLRGADPNIVNNDKTLSLHLAVHTGNLDILKCIYYATSKDAIMKYCTMTENEMESCSGDCRYPIKSLVCLAIDSESIDCLEFILNCGLSYEVLNCPIIIPRGQIPKFFNDIRRYVSLKSYLFEEEHLSNSSDRIVIHPISFLLHEKFPDLKADTSKFLKVMLESGLIFDCFCYKTDLFVIHPLEVAIFLVSSYGEKNKDVIIDCFRLMLEHGISPDYTSSIDSSHSIPILFVYACRLGFIEMIPYLLKYSNLVEIDDLLKWFFDYIFTHKSPLQSFADDLIETYEYLKHHTSLPNLNEFKKPEHEKRFNDVVDWFNCDNNYQIPCLKNICRTVIRRAVRDSCRTCPHQFKIRLNSLELPPSVLSFMKYEDLCNFEPEEV